jgi:predicted protein tyrosine phosphatase
MPIVRNVQREMAEAFEPEGEWACISISQPGDPARLSRKFWAVLRVQFADWDLDRYEPSSHPALAVTFTREMAARIAEFAAFVRGSNILVHCDAGVSRSGAVVEVLLEAFPEYVDTGSYLRHGNNYVRRLLRRQFGLAPTGAELVMTPDRSHR